MFGVLVLEIVAFMLLLSLRPSNTAPKKENIDDVLPLESLDENSLAKNTTPLFQPDASTLRDSAERSDAYVSHYLHKLDPKQYIVLDNLLLPSERSHSGMTQVDHVVVSTCGIFVIETKGHTGYIFGSKQSKMWTQCKYGGVRSSFNSPVHQNYCHKQAVLNILEGRVFEPMHSMCIFPFASKLKVQDCPNVFDTEEALNYVLSQRRRIYSNIEVNRIVEMLLKANRTDDYSYDNHVAKLKLHFAS